MQLAGLSPCLETGPVQLTHGVAHLLVLPAADIVSHWTWAGEHLVEAGSLSAAMLEEAIARQKSSQMIHVLLPLGVLMLLHSVKPWPLCIC